LGKYAIAIKPSPEFEKVDGWACTPAMSFPEATSDASSEKYKVEVW
jgi:hypothetical protein